MELKDLSCEPGMVQGELTEKFGLWGKRKASKEAGISPVLQAPRTSINHILVNLETFGTVLFLTHAQYYIFAYEHVQKIPKQMADVLAE